MAVQGVLRPGFIQLRVLDIDAALAHYRDRIGLDEVARGDDGRVYLKGYDEFDRHSVILREADTPGMDVLGFKVLNDDALESCATDLAAGGFPVSEIEPGEQPGVGRRIAFDTPSGHRIELYAEMALSANGPMTQNPELWRDEPRAMCPVRFDHCLLYGGKLNETVRLFRDILGFSVSESGLDANGDIQVVFLSCSNKTHDVAFVDYPEDGRFHHCAFWLDSWHDIGHAADLIARYEIPLDIGPTRHGATRGQTIYFFDPSGNRNEVFAGGYMYYPDSPQRSWNAESLGKNIFYYERALNERFLTVVT